MKSDFKSYLDISLSFQTLPSDEVFPLLLKKKIGFLREIQQLVLFSGYATYQIFYPSGC